MEPRPAATLPTGPTASRRPPVIVREISAQQTYALRHAVLWPDKPMSYVQLPDDEAGQHFGAFISSSNGSNGEVGINHSVDANNNNNYNNIRNHDGDPTDQDNANNAKDNVSHSSTCGSGNLAGAGSSSEGEELISVLSLFVDQPNGATTTTTKARFRKFATAHRWQGKGAGTALLRRAVDEAASRGATSLWCDARASALPFYERFGFWRAEGEGKPFYKGGVAYLRLSRRLP
ncbi:acyl-CoA N-acyltransferase [Annulohypoxylon truncatum]|uniref:acyl-CoA N-acyltransferase n=1 Tax=Annulohypoxylon truncatum TaxID=327061 RepID=UPI0020086BDA|nr:acyl-CoA N-acyltransferase [Annulohypoxylon truncatum]KAI1208119.1 acyl-CoA N-acyltransferase [Annulohypoxylon truncatum]